MATTTRTTLVTPRDLDILKAVDRSPLTALQLLKLSETFCLRFTTERRVRERLHVLCSAGWVRRSQYATASSGALNYYLLTKLGYQILHGPDAVAPTKRYFSPVGIASQHHTQSLADFIVHTALCAHRAGVAFTGFSRENTLRLDLGSQSQWPDCGFQLIGQDFIAVRSSTKTLWEIHTQDRKTSCRERV